ncbi:hypothetical protein R5R35_003726 [Gryllus longicercus]|uniref:Uncharacterized protein n=1 Tax=Gryllus longicercus TaxID=2509291 RepID=A0AAN9W8I6_9ORTH
MGAFPLRRAAVYSCCGPSWPEGRRRALLIDVGALPWRRGKGAGAAGPHCSCARGLGFLRRARGLPNLCPPGCSVAHERSGQLSPQSPPLARLLGDSGIAVRVFPPQCLAALCNFS